VPTSTMTSKGQITIPQQVREAMGLRAGTKVNFVPLDDGFKVVALRSDAPVALKGRFAGRVKEPASVEAMDQAIGLAAAASRRLPAARAGGSDRVGCPGALPRAGRAAPSGAGHAPDRVAPHAASAGVHRPDRPGGDVLGAQERLLRHGRRIAGAGGMISVRRPVRGGTARCRAGRVALGRGEKRPGRLRRRAHRPACGDGGAGVRWTRGPRRGGCPPARA